MRFYIKQVAHAIIIVGFNRGWYFCAADILSADAFVDDKNIKVIAKTIAMIALVFLIISFS